MKLLHFVLIISLMIFSVSCGSGAKQPAQGSADNAGAGVSGGDVASQADTGIQGDDSGGSPYGVRDELGDMLGDDEEVARVAKFREFADTLKLVEDLSSAEVEEQAKAMNELMAMGPTAVEGLKVSLTHDDPMIRVKGAMALGKLGEIASDAVPELIDALSDEYGPARVEAATALGNIGAASQPALARLRELEQSDQYMETVTAEKEGEAFAEEVFPVRLAARQAIAMINRALREQVGGSGS